METYRVEAPFAGVVGAAYRTQIHIVFAVGLHSCERSVWSSQHIHRRCAGCETFVTVFHHPSRGSLRLPNNGGAGAGSNYSVWNGRQATGGGVNKKIVEIKFGSGAVSCGGESYITIGTVVRRQGYLVVVPVVVVAHVESGYRHKSAEIVRVGHHSYRQTGAGVGSEKAEFRA